VKNKHAVTVLNRGNSPIKYPEGVAHVKMDRNKTAQLKEYLKDQFFDCIVDLSISEVQQAKDAIDLFTGKTGRYILISSLFVYPYGQNLNEEQFDPYSFQYQNLNLSKVSSSDSKKIIEAIILQNSKFIAVSLRLPFVVGVDDPQAKLKKLIQKVNIKEEIYLPNLDARISLINVEDTVRSILHVMTMSKSNVFNCSPELPISIGAMMKMIEIVTYREFRKADQGNPKTLCAFSIKSDFNLDGTKLKNTGIALKPITQWLNIMIEAHIKEYNLGEN
jgi:hypothetical protein